MRLASAFSGSKRDRTANLRLAKPALSQLSYRPESFFDIYSPG